MPSGQPSVPGAAQQRHPSEPEGSHHKLAASKLLLNFLAVRRGELLGACEHPAFGFMLPECEWHASVSLGGATTGTTSLPQLTYGLRV